MVGMEAMARPEVVVVVVLAEALVPEMALTPAEVVVVGVEVAEMPEEVPENSDGMTEDVEAPTPLS